MKTKIPKTINVMGHDYRVIWVTQEKMNGQHRGECEWPARVIRLSLELKPDKIATWSYFLHEVKHAHQFENGDMQVLDKQAIEMHADQFSSLIQSLQSQGIL